MDTTTLITGAGALTATGFSLYDRKNKTINQENAKSWIASSVAVTATAIASESLNASTMKQIHQEYAAAYVQSMSDEELVAALEQMDLLMPKDETTVVDTKTI